MPQALLLKVKDHIQKKKFFRNQARICIGVSGGADSVALLLLMTELKHYWGLHLTVLHFDHQLRAASKKDKTFVQELAEEKGIAFKSASWAIKEHKRKGSLEENARRARYAFFQKECKAIKADALVLAHTENDQAETVFMRFIKGGGLTGYQGILEDRIIDGMRVLRPLLFVQKKELLGYLRINKQAFREDSSNKEIHLTRNRIRQRVLPLLEDEFKRSLTPVLARSADLFQTDFDYIQGQARKYFKKCATVSKRKVEVDLRQFRKAHLALQRMMLRLAIQELAGSSRQVTFQHIQQVEDLCREEKATRKIQWPHNIYISLNSNITNLVLMKKS